MRLTAPPGLLGRRAVKTSTPSSVTSSVCSNCADHEPSRVDDVQLSGHVWSRNEPSVSIGSIVNVIPGLAMPGALL